MRHIISKKGASRNTENQHAADGLICVIPRCLFLIAPTMKYCDRCGRGASMKRPLGLSARAICQAAPTACVTTSHCRSTSLERKLRNLSCFRYWEFRRLGDLEKIFKKIQMTPSLRNSKQRKQQTCVNGRGFCKCLYVCKCLYEL